MSEGGEVSQLDGRFCDKEGDHYPHCQLFAGGGEALDIRPLEAAESPQAPLDIQPLNDPSIAEKAMRQEKYGGPGTLQKAIVEGVGEGIAGPLAPLAETKLMGIPGEDITGRAEAHPIAHEAAKAAGLVGSVLMGGQAPVLAKAAGVAERFLGATGVKAAATKLGAESALLTLGDEVSKYVKGSPDSIQMAAAKVGLSGLLGAGVGGGLGKVSQAWSSRVAPQAEQFVKDFTDYIKANAKDGVETAGEVAWEDVASRVPMGGKAPGYKAAKGFLDKVSNMASEAIADTAGAFAGHLTNIPGAEALGAYIGHHGIKPLVRTILPTLIKPILETESSAAGMKAAFDAVNSILQGETLANEAVKVMFEQGTSTSLDYLLPDQKRIDQLEKSLHHVAGNPDSMFEVGGDTGHYMPQHQSALAATAQNAVSYINSQRPRVNQPAPLDRAIAPSAAQMSDFNRTLAIAEQPLSILSFAHKGTLKHKDLQDLQVLYPHMAPSLIQKVSNSMIEHMSKGKSVPFRMRGPLGVMLGKPMDSTFTQPAIMAAQISQAPKPPPQPPGSTTPKRSTAKLGKSSKMAEMPQERRHESLLK
jgi:hypothetical protein